MVLRRLLERPSCFHTRTFVDLLSSRPLSRSLDSSSDKVVAHLGVGEVLAMEDLKFPVLLDKSDDGDGFVGERDPEDGSHQTCELRCVCMLLFETT